MPKVYVAHNTPVARVGSENNYQPDYPYSQDSQDLLTIPL